jgi:hypothetical protein
MKNPADAIVTQLLIPLDDFERGVSFYRDLLGIPLLFSLPPKNGVLPARRGAHAPNLSSEAGREPRRG